MAGRKEGKKRKACERYRARKGGAGSKAPRHPGSNPQPPLEASIILAAKRGNTARVDLLRSL